MHQPIDIVYLWVDPTDEKWVAEKNKWMSRITGKSHIDATHAARFRDNGEFLHSLRSVAECAPWVNHIYIITGFDQVPKWLNTSHPKITVVAHRDIMPADALPTFNSDAIEMCIPNIKGLSERFLLMNDDMFFARPLRPGYFFDRHGRAIVRHSTTRARPNRIDNKSNLYTANLVHSAQLIEQTLGWTLYHMRPTHGIDPYLKSSWVECASHPEIAPIVTQTIYNKFRQNRQTQRWIFNLYDFAKGRAITIHSRARKFTRHKILNMIYNSIHWHSIRNSPVCCTNAHKAYKAIKHAPILCLNDSVDSGEDVLAANALFLEQRWPNKCEFEK